VKRERICRIGVGVALAITAFETLPAWSQPAYQIPDGRRADCSDKRPLDGYKRAQDQEIKKLHDANERRTARRTSIAEEVAAADERHTNADNEVKAFRQQIGENEDALKRAQGDEKRLLESELGALRTKRIEKSAEVIKAYNDWKDAGKRLQDIENDIKNADAQLARYEGRKTAADASYKEHCSCKEPFAWNALNQKCECALSCDTAATTFATLDRAACKCVCDECCERSRKAGMAVCGGQSR